MVFVVLEGFSGTGKTTLAKELEGRGWLRLPESAHAVPKVVPLADKADTFSDYSLLGATMVYSSVIVRARGKRDIVSEGYLLSDLAYARVRYELKKSDAYPSMMALCRRMLEDERLRPDVYVLLQARPGTLAKRQKGKGERERSADELFRGRYYSALAEIHEHLGETKVEKVYTDSDPKMTLKAVLAALRKRKSTPA